MDSQEYGSPGMSKPWASLYLRAFALVFLLHGALIQQIHVAFPCSESAWLK